jgi:hypothetical protein
LFGPSTDAIHAECEGFWIEVTAALRFELATGRQLKSSDIYAAGKLTRARWTGIAVLIVVLAFVVYAVNRIADAFP